MGKVLETLELESKVLDKEDRVGSPNSPRISWPSTSAADEVAMRSSGGLLALNAAIVAADRRARTNDLKAEEVDPFASFAAREMPPGKRAFDIVFSLAAILVFMPVLLACALAVRLESRGPILFRQRRLGRGGKPFFIVKFRTMVPNAEAVLASYLAANPEAQSEWDQDHKLRRDPRVTRLGRMMRRLSLDELPQFWNVLQGDMSVVGPRPIVPAEVSKYEDGFHDYCSVRPGLTGLWQVSGRNDIGYTERVALDREYVRTLSAKTDSTILLRTVKVVLSAAGSY